MKNTRAAVRSAGLILCALLLALNCTDEFRSLRELPKDIYISPGGESAAIDIDGGLLSVVDGSGIPVTGERSERLDPGARDSITYSIELFGITLKRVTVHIRSGIVLMPGGQTVGINLYTEGVLVVGLGNIETEFGKLSPGRAAGLEPGDIILEVDGERVDTVTALSKICSEAGRGYTLTVERGGETLYLALTPLRDLAGSSATLGVWARDSSAGIGTMSFYDMQTLRCAALGHAVTDPDTGIIIPAQSGKLVRASVMGVEQGRQGMPGEIQASFNSLSARVAGVDENCAIGVYGSMQDDMINPIYPEGLPLAYPEDVHEGPASILSSVSGEMKEYACEIIKVYRQPTSESKGMVIEITDTELIALSGGIVQGMSGSPIIQDGMLAGAVTHVFINDPLKGYGIYSVWMHERAQD